MIHRPLTWILLLAWLALGPTRAVGQIYRWVDEKGVVHYTQGVDNVPERYRAEPTLSPPERTVAQEAVAELKGFESFVGREVGSAVYRWHLRQLDEVVSRKLRAMKRSPVQTAVATALGHYRAAAPFVEGDPAGPRARPDPRCQRLARLPAPRDRSASVEYRSAALQSLWACASDQIAAAERALAVTSGSHPRAERIPMPPKPRR